METQDCRRPGVKVAKLVDLTVWIVERCKTRPCAGAGPLSLSYSA